MQRCRLLTAGGRAAALSAPCGRRLLAVTSNNSSNGSHAAPAAPAALLASRRQLSTTRPLAQQGYNSNNNNNNNGQQRPRRSNFQYSGGGGGNNNNNSNHNSANAPRRDFNNNNSNNSGSGFNRGGRGGGGRGGGGPGRGGGGGGGDPQSRPPRRTRESFLAENAQQLLTLKRQAKASRSGKERQEIAREARRLLRATRVDPSTTDEQSVTLVLNAAAAFRAPSEWEGLVQAAAWARRNVAQLSPQNLALFANALGVLNDMTFPDSDAGGAAAAEEAAAAAAEASSRPPHRSRSADVAAVLLQDVGPAVAAAVKDMTPVEVVMVLQAFQRARVRGNEELQVSLLEQLAPCIPTMPVPQLSTLCEVLTRHPLRRAADAAGRERWVAIAREAIAAALKDAERMHSHEVVTLLALAPRLPMEPQQAAALRRRATAVVDFFTDEEVAALLLSLRDPVRHGRHDDDAAGASASAGDDNNSDATAAAAARAAAEAAAELAPALVNRLERVAAFASVRSAADIWRGARECAVLPPSPGSDGTAAAAGLELPLSVHQALAHACLRSLGYRRVTLAALSRVATALAMQPPEQLRAAESGADVLLHALADVAVGHRVMRGPGGTIALNDSPYFLDAAAAEGVEAAAADGGSHSRSDLLRALYYGRHLGDAARLRVSLEAAMRTHGVGPARASLTRLLPQHLLEGAPHARLRPILAAVRWLTVREPWMPAEGEGAEEGDPAARVTRNTENDAAVLAALAERLEGPDGAELAAPMTAEALASYVQYALRGGNEASARITDVLARNARQSAPSSSASPPPEGAN